ncbi:hypothetical protein MRX96_016187 [Rhipicephalus microplus]
MPSSAASPPPSRLPSGATEQGMVSWRLLPEPGVCDYFVIDIEPSVDGSYDESQYQFLLDQKPRASRFLFTLSSTRSFSTLRTQFGQLPFQNSAAQLRQSLGVRGFGLLDGDRGTSGSAVTEIAIRSTALLFAPGTWRKTSRTSSHFAQVALWKNLPLFARLLEALDGLVRFIILLSISAPRSSCVVEATTAWNNTTGCFISDGMQPTVEECLQLITSVPKPKSQFALTLTLRMDVFVDVDYSRQADEQARNQEQRRRQGMPRPQAPLRRGTKEAKSTSTSFGTTAECKFVISMSQNERRVETFETPASIERVMVRAHESLGEKNHGKLSWFLYNVTSYVATGPCPRGQTRIDKVREVLERYRRKTGSRS